MGMKHDHFLPLVLYSLWKDLEKRFYVPDDEDSKKEEADKGARKGEVLWTLLREDFTKNVIFFFFKILSQHNDKIHLGGEWVWVGMEIDRGSVEKHFPSLSLEEKGTSAKNLLNVLATPLGETERYS